MSRFLIVNGLALAFFTGAAVLATRAYHWGYKVGRGVRERLTQHEVDDAMAHRLLRSGLCIERHPVTGGWCLERVRHGDVHSWACNRNAAAGPICRLPAGHNGPHEAAA